jgi:streptomycin 6-kinase
MAAFPVPQYLAETAARESAVARWMASLPHVVAEFADRWSLRLGVPFEPGGQCSWTAPATGAGGVDLVLKVAFRFGGGEERDEVAGLRCWDGNGVVRLNAASDSESEYVLLLERVRLWLFARAVQESIGSPLLREVARRLAPA